MQTYQFYDKKDLDKFLTTISYTYRDNVVPELAKLSSYGDTIENQIRITQEVKALEKVNSVELRNDVYNRIKEKEESIEKMQKEIEYLKIVKDAISETNTVSRAFEKIIQIK